MQQENNNSTTTNINEPIPFMNTLTSCVNKAVKDGYVEGFKVTAKGLYAPSKDKYFQPEQIKVINFYRFEGQSDPADNAIMYVIETDDGIKGSLIDAYGAYSEGNVTAFMTDVENMNKKANTTTDGSIEQNKK